jgi:hypothetical protein
MISKDLIAEKMDRLRNIYTNKDDKQRLLSLNEKIIKLITDSEYCNNEIVKSIVDDAESRVDAINIILARDEEIQKDQTARLKLFIERDLIENFIIASFSLDSINKRIDAQVKAIDSAIKRYDNS